MVTLEERELFLKAVLNPSSIPYKPEPRQVRAKKRKVVHADYDLKLDLHALTAEVACARVNASIMRCLELGLKRMLIIHGKGSGVLRYEIRTLLANHQHVAQIQDVPPRLGGDGAVFVLLRSTAARHVR